VTRFAAVAAALALLGPAGASAQMTPEAEVRAAVERYNQAMISKDLDGLKAMLAPDVVLYEHSVRNIGLEDVWEHHLRPEVAGFEGMKAEFSDVRVWVPELRHVAPPAGAGSAG
jgi:ketosteroid isomerase-like protein